MQGLQPWGHAYFFHHALCMFDKQFLITCLPLLYEAPLLHCVALCHAIQSVLTTPGSDGFRSCAPEQTAQGRESFATLMYLAVLTEAKLVLGKHFEQEEILKAIHVGESFSCY